MVSDTLTKALSTTSTDIADNGSSSSERKQPNWASRSHQYKLEGVSGERKQPNWASRSHQYKLEGVSGEEKSRKNTYPSAGLFLASQPTGWSEIGSGLP